MVVRLLAGDDTVHLGKGVVGNRLVDAQGISLGQECVCWCIILHSGLDSHHFILQYLQFSHVLFGDRCLSSVFFKCSWYVPDTTPDRSPVHHLAGEEARYQLSELPVWSELSQLSQDTNPL